MRVLLLSTYDLGHQPFAVASAAAWLRRDGHHVTMSDLAIDTLPSMAVREAEVVGLSLPMHTATRLAVKAIERVRLLNPDARLCAFGLYAGTNREYLESLGVDAVFGGEFEHRLCRYVAAGERSVDVSLDRLQFLTPDRTGLPGLARYARLHLNGATRTVGYTEASRGCKHLCRHCPVVPVYGGVFRVVAREVVLEDIRRQVEAGASHITFGDPDFLNGPSHARRIVELLHERWPELTWDATVKIEHLLRHQKLLPLFRDCGCLFITSAVESVDDHVLALLDKGHSAQDFREAAALFRSCGIAFSPTFIPFTPWTTAEGYADLLRAVADLHLVENVAPVQLALRLLVTPESKLLELPEIRERVTGLDRAALLYRWSHSDPAMDAMAAEALRLVHSGQKQRLARHEIFAQLWVLAEAGPLPPDFHIPKRATIPYMDEPWYC